MKRPARPRVNGFECSILSRAVARCRALSHAVARCRTLPHGAARDDCCSLRSLRSLRRKRQSPRLRFPTCKVHRHRRASNRGLRLNCPSPDARPVGKSQHRRRASNRANSQRGARIAPLVAVWLACGVVLEAAGDGEWGSQLEPPPRPKTGAPVPRATKPSNPKQPCRQQQQQQQHQHQHQHQRQLPRWRRPRRSPRRPPSPTQTRRRCARCARRTLRSRRWRTR